MTLKLHTPPEEDRREYVGKDEAYRRFAALLEAKPELKAWAERAEREPEGRGR